MAATPTGQRPTIAAEAFLRALADHGTDYFFANPGTDFPPIVEAFTRAKKTNAKVPKPILVPHENLAVAMAHGAYLMNGRPQAVMVHVNVGTANTINNLTNLSRDRVPSFSPQAGPDHRKGRIRLANPPDPLGTGNV
jgi:acetolactate synthase-1/2/3 large subunit